MDSDRSTLLLLVAVVMLVAGCQTTPSSNAGDASNQPVAPATKESTPPPPAAPNATSAPAPGANATSMSTIELQQRLTKLGYKPGPVDGIVGSRTTNALKKFQKDHKLTVTGILDAETILALHKP